MDLKLEIEELEARIAPGGGHHGSNGSDSNGSHGSSNGSNGSDSNGSHGSS